MKSAQRSSNIELLRIISMMLIIATHLFGHHIDMVGSEYPFPRGYVFYWVVKSITYIAVNMYVLISAYFLCQSEFKIKRIFLLWLEVLFYSIIIGLPSALTSSIKEGGAFITIFFPILFNEYWFATVFMGMLVLSPFINMTLRAFTEKTLRYFCLILLLLFSVIPSFIGPFSRWLSYGGSCGILWFVVLYYIAAYIRMYVDLEVLQKKKITLLIFGLFFSVFAALSRFVIVLGSYHLIGHAVGGGFFYGNNIIFNVIGTITIFLFFLLIKINNIHVSLVINALAKSSFAVYLIHENPFISPILTEYAPHYISTNSIWFPAQFLYVLFSIWFACTVIDFVRQCFFKPLSKVNLSYFDKQINSLLNEE